MQTVKTADGVEIFYKDWGPKDAQPIVFHHGWPLSSDDWDAQMLFFLSKGYRVVAHDRRGHGRSTQVGTGHDMDHYASDTLWSDDNPCRRDQRRPSGIHQVVRCDHSLRSSTALME
jgi:pimeloyl-ACP methyl ester carboxylesterase